MMRRGVEPLAAARGRLLAFAMVCAPDLAYGVTAEMTSYLVGVLR